MSDLGGNVHQFIAPTGPSTPTVGKGSAVTAGDGSGPHDPGMERRISALETDMKSVLSLTVRIDERTKYLATKGDVSQVRTDLMVALASKAGRGTVWTMGATMMGIVLTAAALGAVYMPYFAALLRRVGQLN